jgi:hypothetical protein
MSVPVTELAPEHRAVLSLVLTQGRGYGEIAELLGSDRAAVRARAHAAAEQLVSEGEAPDAPTRRLVIDYLLGAQTHSQRVRTCYLLAGSASDREWAMGLSRALAPLTKVPLPVIPGARLARPHAPPPRHPVRRLVAGAALIAAAAAVVALVVPLIGGGGRAPRLLNASTSFHGRTLQHLVLTPVRNPRASGAGAVLSQGDTMLLLLQARGLAPNRGNSYAVWLFNTPGDARLLGLVSPKVGRGGRFSSGATLPDDAVRFHTVLVTRETSSDPSAPGPAVLRAPLPLR